MQRNENESFDAYKVRRAEANQAVKNINAECKGGKGPEPRFNRPNKGDVNWSYGEGLRRHFARKRAESIQAKKK